MFQSCEATPHSSLPLRTVRNNYHRLLNKLFFNMKFFKKQPSQAAVLVQELQLALMSAQESNRSLNNQLQREREDRTMMETSLNEANRRSQQLQDKLELSDQALRASRAEVSVLQAENHGLREENQGLKHSISERDSALLKEEMDSQRERSQMVIEALKSSYGQLKVSNQRLQQKITELEGQRDQQQVHNVQTQQDCEALRQQLLLQTQELSEERQKTKVLQEDLDKYQTTNQALEHNLQDREAMICDLETVKRSLEDKIQVREEHISCLETKVTETKTQLQKLVMKLPEQFYEKAKERSEERQNLIRDRLHALQESRRISKEYQEEKQAWKMACERSAKDLEGLQLKLRRKEETIRSFNETISRLQMELKEQKDQVKTVQEPLPQNELMLKTLRKENQDLKEACEKAAKETEDVRAKLTKQAAFLDNELEESAKIILDHEDKIKDLQIGRSGLLEQLIEARKTISQLESEKKLQISPPKPEERQRSGAQRKPAARQHSNNWEDFRRKNEEVDATEERWKKLRSQGQKRIENFRKVQHKQAPRTSPHQI